MGGRKSDASGERGGSAASNQDAAFEAEPDAWERFEKAVGKVVKAPPRHRDGARVGSVGRDKGDASTEGSSRRRAHKTSGTT